MKKINLGFLLCLILLIFPAFQIEDDNAWKKISCNINELDGRLEKLTVEGHSIIKSNHKISDIANNIYKKLGIREELEKSATDGKIFMKSRNMQLLVRSTKNSGEYYISACLSQYEQIGNINNIRETISKAFSDYQQNPDISSLAIYRFDKFMTVDKMKKYVTGILTCIGAENTKGINDRNLVSYRGYISGLEKPIEIENGFTDINIGMRTVEEDGYTYMYVGSPIIAVEY